MAVKRTTIELDDDLVKAAQAITGTTLRATVEQALRQLVTHNDDEAATRRRRVADHLEYAGAQIDVDVLLSDEAWR
jgi:Arc/MetJ family transcription regulator